MTWLHASIWNEAYNVNCREKHFLLFVSTPTGGLSLEVYVNKCINEIWKEVENH